MGKTANDLKITGYWLNYQLNSDLVRVWVTTESSDTWILVNEINPEKASFIKAMLESGSDVFLNAGESLHISKKL